MNSQTSRKERDKCLKSCEDKFIRHTARKPVGGAEMLRVCRTACPRDPLEDKRSEK